MLATNTHLQTTFALLPQPEQWMRATETHLSLGADRVSGNLAIMQSCLSLGNLGGILLGNATACFHLVITDILQLCNSTLQGSSYQSQQDILPCSVQMLHYMGAYTRAAPISALSLQLQATLSGWHLRTR